MTLTCYNCKHSWESFELGALYLTEIYPKHVGEPPEIYHFCSYKCLREMC